MLIPKDAADLFDRLLPEGLVRAQDRARQLDTVLRFVVGDDAWTIDCSRDARPPTCVRAAVALDVRCTVEVSPADFQSMLEDPKVATQLYFQGKLKLTGDPTHVPKIAALFDLVRPQ